jgi:heme/copper-type cytochrome/quinol oxidase subunit 4
MNSGDTSRHKAGGKVYIVYAAIMALAAFQVVVAMQRGPSLVFMLLVGVLQAWLAVTYFMHLGEERPLLVLALIPYTIFVLLMMNAIWSDSFRLLRMRPH